MKPDLIPQPEPETLLQALHVFVSPAGKQQPLDGEWRIHFADPTVEAANLASEGLDDSQWERVELPHLGRATAARDTLWYRQRFSLQPQDPDQRLLLHFGGAFYETSVWLNGSLVGEHAGYFQPFDFDITASARPGENLLAVCCRFPVEAGNFREKTAVAGVFADWDCKPYPSSFFPDLPEQFQWFVPVGLWQPVSLWACSPLLIESLNVFPEVINPLWPARDDAVSRAESARLRVRVQVRNLSPDPQSGSLRLKVTPHNFDEDAGASLTTQVWLAAGTVEAYEFQLTLDQPRLWLPWTHGDPWLYQFQAVLGQAEAVEQVFGIREIRAVISADRWEWRLNGRRIFPKGSNYISDFFLSRATPERLRQDIELARQANLDLLRVHAHIEPQAFYRLCDELGMLVWCDFPLIWTYAYDLPAEAQQAFHDSVLRQAGDMVHLLGSRPSIVLWSMHNEPPWTPDGSFLGAEVHASRTNQAVDQAAAGRVQDLDPTRPVIAASGEFDRHLYHGWYTGSWQDNRTLSPVLPTEFGVQALPDPKSPVWEDIPHDWPLPPDHPGWAYAGYQSIFFTSPGVGPPGQFNSLEQYSAASQGYQAFYIRYVIDQWRKKKFAPVGGYIHHFLADCFPGLTWSVLDYERRPKAGYHALAQAGNAVRLLLDVQDGFQVERVYRLVYKPGSTLKLHMLLVNDDYRQHGPVQVRWWLEPKGEIRLRSFLRRALRSQAFYVELPGADQPAQPLFPIEIPLRKEGVFTLRAEVRQSGRLLDENCVNFRVGDKRLHTHVWRRIPRFLVNKVYRVGSLQNSDSGFTFQLHNPAMPVTILRLGELKVDQQPVETERVQVTSAAGMRPAATIDPEEPFHAASGEYIEIRVQHPPLPPGAHTLEVTAELVGFGEITAEIRDRIP